MPIHIERMTDQPILIATYTGDITAEDILGMFEASLALIEPHEDRLFRINDVREGNTDFIQLMQLIKQLPHDLPGSSGDHRFVPCFVGRRQMAGLYNDLVKRRQDVAAIPVFNTMEDALKFIDVQRKT